MRAIAFETVADALVVLLEVVAMVALSVVGLLAERAGFTHLATGVDPLALWFLLIGTTALYAGVYMLGYRTLLPKLRGGDARSNG